MQQTANIIVLIAAVIALITAFVPLWRWVWRTHLVRHFDAKKAHYDELLEQAKWYEERAVKLDSFHKQLLFGMGQPPDRLDKKDAEWARKIEDVSQLRDACERKQEECMNNAIQAREFANEVGRKVLFW